MEPSIERQISAWRIRTKARRWVYLRWCMVCLTGGGLIIYGGNTLPSPPPRILDSSTTSEQIQRDNMNLQIKSNAFIYLMVGVGVTVISFIRIILYAHMNNMEDYDIEELIERSKLISSHRQGILGHASPRVGDPVITVHRSDPLPLDRRPMATATVHPMATATVHPMVHPTAPVNQNASQQNVEYRETNISSIPYISIQASQNKPKHYDWYRSNGPII